jgi:chorismate dehydratase
MKVRVSAISYLNTAPFVYGLENHPVSGMIEVEYVPPAVTAAKLISGEADLGLVPVAMIRRIPNPVIVSQY